jgi:hypothetical protein
LPLFGPILKAWFLCRTQNSQTSVNKVIPNWRNDCAIFYNHLGPWKLIANVDMLRIVDQYQILFSVWTIVKYSFFICSRLHLCKANASRDLKWEPWLQATQIVYIPRQLILCSSSYTMSPWREEDMPGQYVSLESVAEAAFRFHCTHNHVESLQHRTPIRDYIKKWLKQLQIMWKRCVGPTEICSSNTLYSWS